MENWKKMLAAYRDTLKGIEADEKLSDAGKAEARNEAFGRIKEARRKLAADYENRKAEIDAELAAMKRPSPPTLEAEDYVCENCGERLKEDEDGGLYCDCE